MNTIALHRTARRFAKPVAVYLLLNFAAGIFYPTAALALTSGPGQPEFSSFEPASTSDMVDIASGDFTYNIPLLNIPGPNGGYPINLAYHSGVGMEQEASWVGLGWTLNVGAVNRQLRGIPDDFSGENVTQVFHTRKDWTVTANLSPQATKSEFVGLPIFGFNSNNNPFSWNWQFYFNSFRGLGVRLTASARAQNDYLSAGLDLSIDAQNGIGISPSLGVTAQHKSMSQRLNIQSSFNNRSGLQGFSFSTSSSQTEQKKNKEGNDVSFKKTISSSALSFNVAQFVPEANMPIRSISVPVKFTLGETDPLYFFNAEFPKIWSGSYTQSDVMNGGVVYSPAYGYLNTQNASGAGSMIDFNRGQIQYSKKVPNLAPSTFNHDVFVLASQGIGGSFRPERSDVRFLHTPQQVLQSTTSDIGVEVGKGAGGWQVGLDLDIETSVTRSGDWSSGTSAVSGLQKSGNTPDYEPVYFKMYGEQNGEYLNDAYSTHWKGDEAMRLDLEYSGGWLNGNFTLKPQFIYDQPSAHTPAATISDDIALKKTRQKRSKLIQHFTNDEAQLYGFEKSLQYYNSSDVLTGKNFSRNNNHISEVLVTQEDGMRYVFGLPAYNIHQTDVNQSVPQSEYYGGSMQTRMVDVNANSYLSNSTEGVTSQYLNRTNLSPYAHSWLLSSVVSADYVDVDNNGPSEADYGYWVKFRYKKTYDDYKWRVPYQQASFSAGSHSDPLDNTAYYTYGTKEIYYIKTIETKTHIAVFYTSARKDALEAHSEYATAGQTGSRALHRLDKIELFTKVGYEQPSPIPIQTVHFEYDYSLCGNVPNNNGDNSEGDNAHKGKLTLKKVYFTYQNSNRGAMSPYVFKYGEDELNPDYNPLNMDRWGNFADNSSQYPSNRYPYGIYPYTSQDEVWEDNRYRPVVEAGQWSLNTITLPTGGQIQVAYEPDDYAHIEDQTPMQVFDITGIGSLASALSTNRDADGAPVSAAAHFTNDKEYYRIYFKLNRPYAGDNAADRSNYVRTRLLKNLDRIWFKTLMKLNKDENYDYVSGYARVLQHVPSGYTTTDIWGIVQGYSSEYDMGYLTLYAEDLNDVGGRTSPFRKATYQYIKMQRPDLIHATASGPPNGTAITMVASFVNIVFTVFQDLTSTLTGYYSYCQLRNFGSHIKLNGHSVIRLYEPDGKKYGGGARVKSLRLSDNWLVNGNDHTHESGYGQEYYYDTRGDGTGHSTGVAYEPAIGGEENVLRQPVNYTQSTPVSTSYSLFVEKPVMESYYPGPSVTYGKVTVKSIAPTEAYTDNTSHTLENSAAPYTVYEFYTAKDFPVYVDETDINAGAVKKSFIVIPGILNKTATKQAKSQGYSVVLNDMNGKPRSVATYKRFPQGSNPNDMLITRQEYLYRTAAPYSPNQRNKLDNRVQVLNDEGSYQTAVLGETFDVHIDRHENEQYSEGTSMEFNLIGGGTLLIPIFVPIMGVTESSQSMKTAVTVKVIHRSGILKETIVTTEQSSISTENLAYDIYTGQPLLTRVTNEFKDPLYSLSQPAHWYYDGMGAAYKNTGIVFESLNAVAAGGYGGIITGFPSGTVMEDYFTVGDEVYVSFSSGCSSQKAYVGVINTTLNVIILIKEDGTYLCSGAIDKLKIIRSGRRNHISASAGSIAARKLDGFSPSFTSTPATYQVDNTSVLDASVVEFSGRWQSDCPDCDESPSPVGTVQNPFLNGVLGNWRPTKSLAFVTDRNYSDNVREDGTFQTFVPYVRQGVADEHWIAAAEITKYSPYGFEIENKDALGNYSAALYGYNNSLVTAIAKNAKYQEIFFEGFEYYDAQTCANSHLYFEEADLTQLTAHSGLVSLRLDGGQSISHLPVDIPKQPCEPDHWADPSELGPFVMQGCDCIGKFAPPYLGRYVVSAWVKQTEGSQRFTNYAYPAINIAHSNNPGGVDLRASGPIIEGWQRIYGEVVLDGGAFTLTLKNTGPGGASVYFDDLRLHPFHSNLISYVYHPITLKLEAELDVNNYATFYIYDEAGHLNKVKKETVKGIKTIKEGRISNTKQAQ